MSQFKYRPWTYESHPRFRKLINKRWFVVWNHWINPFGNYHEPLPFPESRDDEAPKNDALAWMWWSLRNPLHNFTHFWVGITPLGARYEWITPQERGWTQGGKYWTKGKRRRRVFDGRGHGWQSRGNFRMSTGNKWVDGMIILLWVAFFVAAIGSVLT